MTRAQRRLIADMGPYTICYSKDDLDRVLDKGGYGIAALSGVLDAKQQLAIVAALNQITREVVAERKAVAGSRAHARRLRAPAAKGST